jgi:hypothetical protein
LVALTPLCANIKLDEPFFKSIDGMIAPRYTGIGKCFFEIKAVMKRANCLERLWTMITMDELLGHAKLAIQSNEVKKNLALLLQRINKVRSAWGHPMKVTSGLRTMAHHLQIYAQKGITDKSKIPMKSKHLFGAAVDIYDPAKTLQKWCLANEKLLKSIGFWMESFTATPNWCHFQIVPYGSYADSKSIWFKP